MKSDKNTLSGNTAMLILELLNGEDMYGYQMIESLERSSNNVFSLKAGTLYPLLHALEQQKAVESYESEENMRVRKYYHLTKTGKKMLDDKRSEWKEYSDAVNLVLGGKRGVKT